MACALACTTWTGELGYSLDSRQLQILTQSVVDHYVIGNNAYQRELPQFNHKTWRHVALVMDEADNTVRFYIDGTVTYLNSNLISYHTAYLLLKIKTKTLLCFMSSYNSHPYQYTSDFFLSESGKMAVNISWGSPVAEAVRRPPSPTHYNTTQNKINSPIKH